MVRVLQQRRARYTYHRSRGISPSEEGKTLTVSRFVQQSQVNSIVRTLPESSVPTVLMNSTVECAERACASIAAVSGAERY